MLGAAILIWQTTLEETAQPILVGAGLALIGVTGVGSVQRVIKKKLGE